MGDRQGRTWTDLLTTDEVVEALDDLAAAAADGYRVALRPAGDSSLIVLTDLDAAGLHRLREDGLSPVVTTVAGGAHTVWLRLDRAALDPHLAREIARDLAARYSSISGDVATLHSGSLAGLSGVTITGSIRRDALVSSAMSEALIAAAQERWDRSVAGAPATEHRPHDSGPSQPDANDHPRPQRPGRAGR